MLELIVTGNLGRDPEMRYTASGQAVTSFSVASNRTFTNSAGEKVTQTTWVRVSAWGKLAEVCAQYLKKGRQVLVKGRLNADENGNPRIYNRQDGTPASSFEMTAEQVEFLGGRGSDNGEEAPAAESMSEEIPF